MNYIANEGIWEGQWIETDLDASGQGYSLTDILAEENQTATFTTQW
jgi:inosine/xanthosine triphosphate pyrophosphatase family protein